MNICQVLLLDYFFPLILIQRILIRIQQLFLMSEVKNLPPAFVTWKYEQFTITIQLSHEECFNIRVEDPNTQDTYSQKVDGKLITETEGLKGFADYSEVYCYLVRHLAQAVFKNGSFISRGERPFAIDLNLKGKNEVVAYGEIENLKRGVNVQKVELLNQRDGQLEPVWRNGQSEGQRENARRINAIWATLMPRFFRHPGDPHTPFFTLTAVIAPTIWRLTLQGAGVWYNFINGEDIFPGQRIRYNIRLHGTPNIFIGFCTLEGLGRLSNFNHPESAYYDGNGSLRSGGHFVSSLPRSAHLNLIECEADLVTGILNWRRNNQPLATTQVPSAMRGKNIYLSVLMEDLHNIVDINII